MTSVKKWTLDNALWVTLKAEAITYLAYTSLA